MKSRLRITSSAPEAGVGFESADLTVAAHADLSRRLLAKSHGADLVSTDGIVERLRAVKDDWEIATLRDAGSRLSEAAKRLIPKALPGVVENELAAAVDF